MYNYSRLSLSHIPLFLGSYLYLSIDARLAVALHSLRICFAFAWLLLGFCFATASHLLRIYLYIISPL